MIHHQRQHIQNGKHESEETSRVHNSSIQKCSPNDIINSKYNFNKQRNRSSVLLKENLSSVKCCSKDQWWQLFDTKTRKFFYYNPFEQRTTWHKPDFIITTSSHNTNHQIDHLDCEDQEHISDNILKNPIVIPLASKLIERINTNIILIKKSKKFIKSVKKKLNCDLKYDTNDLNIMSTLTERLLNIQNILTEEEQACSMHDFSRLEMSTFMKLKPTTIDTNDESNSSNLHSPLSSCYSFKSSQSLESTLSMIQNNQLNKKRRLAPRTNPNYVNVDFVNTKNGSLIKNTYVRLQDLTNENESDLNDKLSQRYLNCDDQMCVSSTPASNSQSLSQAILILLSLLTNSTGRRNQMNKESTEQKSTLVNLSSSSSSMNTICSLNMKIKNLKSIDNNYKNISNDQTFSLCSSSATLISDYNQTNTLSRTNRNSKKLMPFKSAAQIGNSNTYSLNRKNLEKNNNILKAAATLNFTGSNIIPTVNNQNSKKLEQEISSRNKPTPFSLFDKSKEDQSQNNENLKLRSFSTQQSTRQQESNEINKINKDISASSTSSLADMKNLFNEQQQQQHQRQLLNNGHLNHRLQTIKRSFNKKTSFKKTTKQADDENQSIRNDCELNTSFESHQFPFESFELDSPGQIKKSNQTNLFLNNTCIDLNTHHHSRLKSGFLFFSSKKKIPPNDLLLFSSQSIQKPLIKTNDKIVKKESCEIFKLIQIYMGDRKPASNFQPTDPNLITKYSSTKFDNETNTKIIQREMICLEIMTKGWIYSQLRDELYLQLVKQTTENPNQQSLLNGWELIAICLTFFPPSQKFFPFLTEYIYSHLFKLNSSFNWLEQLELNQTERNKTIMDNTSLYSLQLIESAKKQQDLINSTDEKKDYLNKMANACLKRLERIHITGAKKGLKKPTLDEILLSKRTITSPSLFGTTLSELMSVQKTKCPKLCLPWIQTTLSEAVLRLNGAKTEGIFRVPGDLDEVNNLKVKYDQLWCSRDVLSTEPNGADDYIDLMANIQDPHLPASLLKLWYRELYEPLIPHEMYDECIRNCDRPAECINVIQRLPQINKLVFTYLIRFLKVFAASENVAVTKMDANNLSMIMAPNCLRCKSNEPKIIMENTKKEMQFLNTLIHHLDTSCVQGII